MIIERQTSSTSSIGAVWPPMPSGNERMRGFYDEVIQNEDEIDPFLTYFEKFRTDVAQDPVIDRLSIRAVTTAAVLGELSMQDGLSLEAAMPIKGTDYFIGYTAWNDPNRVTSDTRLSDHRELIGSIALTPRDQANRAETLARNGFTPRIIDSSTAASQRGVLEEKFLDLYANFGYDASDVEELLGNPNNTIAYIEDESGAVISTAMAEKAVVSAHPIGQIAMTEITEAYTRDEHRGRGLYKDISGYLLSLLLENTDNVDVIYGESNLTMPGVVIAAHQNGRQFSFADRQRLRISNPNFGILQQNFHIADGVEDRPYNDFALSYVPLG